MRVLLCNERFLFRFGVDRVLLLYGNELTRRGHSVSVMANHFDRAVVEEFAQEVVQVPSAGEYIAANEFTAEWLDENWDRIFTVDTAPDVVVVGGWPFLTAIPVFRARGVRVVFNDYGVVPLDNYDGGHRQVLEHLVALRRRFMPECDAVVAISDFIAETQSRFDGEGADVSSILLGADHLANGVWTSANASTASSNSNQLVRTIRKEAGTRPIVMNLGRWEPGCYKNSEFVFEFVDRLRQAGADCLVLILADPDTADIPTSYKDSIKPIGFPDDAVLQACMGVADIGISVSLWEGFNLPLAEMQWLAKPVLCFDVGAHPEVVAHPWFLCTSGAEMADKAAALLVGKGLDSEEWSQAIDAFRNRLTWLRTIDELEARLLSLVQQSRPQILVDVSNAAIDPANSGVIRVTRRLCRALQQYCDPVFVLWDRSIGGYVYPTTAEYEKLSSCNGPKIDDYYIVSAVGRRQVFDIEDLDPSAEPKWLLLPETIMESDGQQIRNWARSTGLKIGAVFYDAIPVLRPDLVKDQRIRENHAAYMRGLAECDLVLPISEYSAQCLGEFWRDHGIAGCAIATQVLPGEFAGAARPALQVLPSRKSASGPVHILCVSTLEPRKNHKRLLAAVESLSTRRPDLDWTLTLVGNRYAGGEDIAETVERACAVDARIKWLGIVDDARLAQAYAVCDFTVYASEIEGFGMPILESVWHGKPCLCHSGGVMSELAADGGCFTVDMADVDALSLAMEKLIEDGILRVKLGNEARGRTIRTWGQYAEGFMIALLADTGVTGVTGASHASEETEMSNSEDRQPKDWQSILYKDCLTAEWQMNDSERLALMAVLARLRPKCAIEVGTYRGGSLSLIAQTAECVYSIDIDPEIPGKYSHIKNARFFTGPSDKVLPLLLDKLTRNNIPVEFVLIDGDHSAEGVRRDIEIMLNYRPTRPMIMMMHDGFNPECRRGMIEAEWQRSPYVHFVDLDFIPGRIVETGGGGSGEMWGGLAMAYFSPVEREGELQFAMTSRQTFERAVQAVAVQ